MSHTVLVRRHGRRGLTHAACTRITDSVRRGILRPVRVVSWRVLSRVFRYGGRKVNLCKRGRRWPLPWGRGIATRVCRCCPRRSVTCVKDYTNTYEILLVRCQVLTKMCTRTSGHVNCQCIKTPTRLLAVCFSLEIQQGLWGQTL